MAVEKMYTGLEGKEVEVGMERAKLEKVAKGGSRVVVEMGAAVAEVVAGAKEVAGVD